MKKILMVILICVVIFLITDTASAWRVGVRPVRPHHPRFGVVIGPPPFFYYGPPVVYYRGYYPPPYSYYPPPTSRYYENGYPVWIPGYWEERPTPDGRTESVWVPGYWKYGP